MKSFIRTKVINGQSYQYEIQPYYDPKTKKVRHKSKYLGKEKDGIIQKVRAKIPHDVLNYGEFLPFLQIIEEYKIMDFLISSFGEYAAKQIIALTLCKTLSHYTLRDVSRWYEQNYISLLYGELNLGSQELSRLLENIGQKRMEDKFTTHLIKYLSSKRTFFYDITSISSYSELITMLEWGYNRDGFDLRQVNLVLTHK